MPTSEPGDRDDLGKPPEISVGEMLDAVGRDGVWPDDDTERLTPSFVYSGHATIYPSRAHRWRTGRAGAFSLPPVMVRAARILATTRARAALLVAGVMLICCCCGVASTGKKLVDNSMPLPAETPATVTVTVTQTVTVTKTVTVPLPKTCLDAIDEAKTQLQRASDIASSQPKVLDIIDRAYSAAVLGDTAKLNAAAEDARKLDMQFSSQDAPLLVAFTDIMHGLETCK